MLMQVRVFRGAPAEARSFDCIRRLPAAGVSESEPEATRASASSASDDCGVGCSDSSARNVRLSVDLIGMCGRRTRQHTEGHSEVEPMHWREEGCLKA